MEKKTILSSFVLSILIISYAIYKNAYINNKLTCNKYILNTYLYIILSLLIVSITILLLDHNNILMIYSKYHNYIFWILFLLTVGFLLLTMNIPPEKTIIKHITWLIFIILIGITLYPIYKLSELSSILSSTIFTTFSLVVILSIIAFYKPELISLSWGPILFILLVAGLILRIGLYLFSSKETSKFSILLSYGFIILFSFLLLYDTKKMQINAINCKIPNYINESLGIFLDIINLFSNISQAKLSR